jgi:3-phosphoshikimate 1-carboxyvinyltransferase
VEIIPVTRPIRATIRPPGSKSITNRALVIAALAEGTSQLDGVLDSDDTRVMVQSLGRLGIPVAHDPAACTATIQGCGGTPPATSAELWLENSGTSIRFLTALACLGRGTYRLDGNARMRQRPIGQLCETLNRLGGNAACEQSNGCPPVLVRGSGLQGGTAEIASNISSQFASAVLMAAPCARSPVELILSGAPVSEPYIEMTIRVMSAFGIRVQRPELGRYQIPRQHYQAASYSVEPDASAASYFFAAAAITGGEVTVTGLSKGSLQGDVRFASVLAQMGCDVGWGSSAITVRGGTLHGIDVDMGDISDTAQTLAVTAAFAEGPTRIRNIAHARQKETDRIHALVVELTRLGIIAEEHDDGLTVHPGALRPATIETYNDHRMAMSFALLGLKIPGIRIADPGCTAKTYPHFFDDLRAVCESGG